MPLPHATTAPQTSIFRSGRSPAGVLTSAVAMILATVLGIVVASMALGAASASAANYSPSIPFPAACGTCVMNAGQALTDSGWSVNMQGDGNLVMRNSGGTACFASNTQGNNNAHVAYQGDGNFVVYATSGAALWSSRTAGRWIGSAYNVSVHAGQFYVGNTLIHGPC